MSLRTTELSALQLQIVMHIANGMSFTEVAKAVARSEANVKYHVGQAKAKCGAKTVPHLVSVVLGQGQLHWDGDQRAVTLPSAVLQTSPPAPA
jgi:DNA-binding CsgD family transcriptional regulator